MLGNMLGCVFVHSSLYIFTQVFVAYADTSLLPFSGDFWWLSEGNVTFPSLLPQVWVKKWTCIDQGTQGIVHCQAVINLSKSSCSITCKDHKWCWSVLWSFLTSTIFHWLIVKYCSYVCMLNDLWSMNSKWFSRAATNSGYASAMASIPSITASWSFWRWAISASIA